MMRWKKLGQIFEIKPDYNFKGQVGFAQSPQALVLEDRIRIYYSTRSTDGEFFFKSHVHYVDFNLSLNRIMDKSDLDVVELGSLGSFDEHGIFPFNPVKVGKKIYGYTCGWSRRVSVPVETSTGLVISKDNGKSYERISNGPILTSSINEPFLVGDSFVVNEGNRFTMWYIFGKSWIKKSDTEPVSRVYKIGQAFSEDGINWKKIEGSEIIPSVLGEDECQALPTVIKIDGTYHMIFCFRESTNFRTNNGRGYRLGYAYSSDLSNWHREEQDIGLGLSENGWDSEMSCYPNLFKVGDEIYLLYNGNEFGKQGFGLAKLESI